MNSPKFLLLVSLLLNSISAHSSSSDLDNNSWQALRFLKKTEFHTEREKALFFNACQVTYTRSLLYSYDNRTPYQSPYCSTLNSTIADKIQRNEMADLSIKLINNHVGYGVFAKHAIAQGQYIGEFAGQLKKIEDRSTNIYYAYHSKGCVVDAGLYGNEIRFINDGEQHSNCEAWAILGHDGMSHIAMIAQRNIEAQEQLTMTYSANFWNSCSLDAYQDMRHYRY